jgi:hypothetical protein
VPNYKPGSSLSLTGEAEKTLKKPEKDKKVTQKDQKRPDFSKFFEKRTHF